MDTLCSFAIYEDKTIELDGKEFSIHYNGDNPIKFDDGTNIYTTDTETSRTSLERLVCFANCNAENTACNNDCSSVDPENISNCIAGCETTLYNCTNGCEQLNLNAP